MKQYTMENVAVNGVTATLIREVENQILWHLDKPLRCQVYVAGEERGVPRSSRYIVTSCNLPDSVLICGPETCAFLADKQGKITNWCKLPGSFRGSHNHRRCITAVLESMAPRVKA